MLRVEFLITQTRIHSTTPPPHLTWARKLGVLRSGKKAFSFLYNTPTQINKFMFQPLPRLLWDRWRPKAVDRQSITRLDCPAEHFSLSFQFQCILWLYIYTYTGFHYPYLFMSRLTWSSSLCNRATERTDISPDSAF